MTHSLVEFVLDVLGAQRYQPQAACLTNESLMLVMYAVAKLTIGFSLLALGATFLWTFRRGAILFPAVKLIFGMLIVLDGFQHLTGYLTIDYAVYRLDVWVKAAAAAVSLVAVILTISDIARGPYGGNTTSSAG